MKILITEDDILTGKLISKVFKQPDNEIIHVSNALSAIQHLENEVFDLALIDIHMPGFDGIELIRYIRNELKLTLPIIVITRDNYKETLFKALEAGADDFINKPFEMNDLYERVTQLINNTNTMM